MKHKILLVISNMLGGGAERVVAYLLRRLDRRFFQPVLVVFNEGNAYADEIPSDVKTICLHKRHNFDVVRLIGNFAQTIISEKPALILSFLTYANFFTILAQRYAKTDIPLLISQRNHLSISLNHVRVAGLKKSLARHLYPRADLIICVSEGVRRDLLENFHLSPGQCVALHNPCDLELIRASAQEDMDHPWFHHDTPVLLACGRLSEQKNYPLLLKAMKRVVASQPVRLIILGEGDQRSRLEAEVGRLGLDQQVAFLGFQKNPFKFMARAAALVLSSDYEGFPNVILEAMACGTPVISTKCPSGPDEIIRDGENGLLVSIDDEQALANAILRLINDDSLLWKIAAAGLKRVADFSIDRIVNNYESVFHEAMLRKKIKGSKV